MLLSYFVETFKFSEEEHLPPLCPCPFNLILTVILINNNSNNNNNNTNNNNNNNNKIKKKKESNAVS